MAISRAPDVNYVAASSVVGLERLSIIEGHKRLQREGFVHLVTFAPGMVNFSCEEKAIVLINLLREGQHRLGDKWTTFFGPDTLWRYSYMFKVSADAVLARLVLGDRKPTGEPM